MSQTARDISGRSAITAESADDLAPSSVRTALQTALEQSDSSESFMELTPPKAVQSPGTRSTSLGSEERAAAFESGRKLGAAAFFNSPIVEGMAIELLMLRAAVAVLSERVRVQARMIEHHKETAEAFREICDQYAELA